MAQSAHPPFDDENESPAERLVQLLEQHGLEDGLRDILQALEARRLGAQQGNRIRLLEALLEGQAPLTRDELELARREWQG